MPIPQPPIRGAKRALQEFVKRLTPRHQVDVFTLGSANHDFADVRPFATHHHIYPSNPASYLNPLGRLNQLVRLADLRRLRKLTRRISQDIAQGGYDVVFVHPCQFEKRHLC
ncbi:MAG: hypothetical protein H6662_19550 [Ardenticatenaceae bacterium]|nr:hypothetical protein [Ardenticatenaceae bacterium]